MSSDKTKLKENPNVLEPFADDFVNFFMHGPILHLTFASHQATPDDPPEQYREVSAKLAISLPAALDMHKALERLFKRLEKQGILKEALELPKNVH